MTCGGGFYKNVAHVWEISEISDMRHVGRTLESNSDFLKTTFHALIINEELL